ncbi:MAG: NAD(P)H-dependent oxidoreductase subunit E [Pseudomonadota bacterium]|nr:NAD(P)H-dependent oxidoreductase subunit E [Pseudomonadota bacterium]
MTYNLSVEDVTADLLRQWGHDPYNLLQILIGVQQVFNHVPSAALELIAEKLSLTPANIEGVIGFYSFLHVQPRGLYDLLISDNIVDQMSGSRELAGMLAQRLGVEPGMTRADGAVSLGYTSCTGMGDQGPAALVNNRTLTLLTPQRIEQIAGLIKERMPLGEWPQELFVVGENIQRRDLLLGNDLQQGSAIRTIVDRGAEQLLNELEASGLRGRGGAGFKTALKWRFCRDASADERVVVCNADEGEPGTFKDRVLLQAYADRVFEGMTLCAGVIGASRGFLYLRAEYLYLLEDLQMKLQRRRDANLLGDSILGQAGFDFDIEIHLGAGAYICGEESALIESLEGKRGIPRIRPPFPVTEGYRGRPTVVNNVETLVAAAMIAANGAEWFRSRGTEESAGTKLLSISGDCSHPGVYEYPYGVNIETILRDCGAEDVQAVQIAGPAGECVPPSEFHRSIAFEDLSTGGSMMIFSQQRNLLNVIENFNDFFVHESCGFCTPCRVGTTLLQKRLHKVVCGHATSEDLVVMSNIGSVVREGSHCGLGATAANPILGSMEKFPDIYEARLKSTSFEPAFDLDAALQEARQISGRDDAGAHIEGGGV